ncbi:uncharacterized protein VSU04_003239 [Chlamydotis macqueenii]
MFQQERGNMQNRCCFIWISKADIKSEPFNTQMTVVSTLGYSLAESLEKIHPSNTVWVLRHRNRSCENQECLESEQAVDNSGLETDREDNSSTCPDSGHVEKRRKINHLAIQKAKQYLNHMNKDNVKLTESIVTLEEQSLQKLSEISSAFPTLASFFMNIKISKGCPRFKED